MDSMDIQPLAEAAMSVSHKMTYAGSAVTVISGLTISEIGVIAGIGVAVLGLVSSTVINIWYRREQLKIMRKNGGVND